jgi:hypothetical protein
MKNARDLSTAYHEAGHAIAAYRFGMRLREITIEPEQGSQGSITGEFTAGITRDIEGEVTAETRLHCEQYAIHALAGTEAQRKFNARSLRSHHGHSDYHNAVDVLSRLCSSPEHEQKYYDAIQERTRAFVHDPVNWRAIDALAKELMRKRTIKGKELREYIRSACFAPVKP